MPSRRTTWRQRAASWPGTRSRSSTSVWPGRAGSTRTGARCSNSSAWQSVTCVRLPRAAPTTICARFGRSVPAWAFCDRQPLTLTLSPSQGERELGSTNPRGLSIYSFLPNGTTFVAAPLLTKEGSGEVCALTASFNSGAAMIRTTMAVLAALCAFFQPLPGKSCAMKQSNRDTEIRDHALKVLRASLNGGPINSMHAAEVLCWNGYAGGLREIYGSADSIADPRARAGAWRVLAQLPGLDKKTRESYVLKVRDFALDTKGPYNDFALESLAKLG